MAQAYQNKSGQALDIVKTVVVVVVGYKVLGLISNWGSDARTGEDSGTSQDTACKGPFNDLSYPALEYDIAADLIETAIFGSDAVVDWTEDDELIANTLMYMQTNDDVAKLICRYYERGYGFISNVHVGLVMVVGEYLNEGEREDVNEDYASKGIAYRF